MRTLNVQDQQQDWFTLGKSREQPLDKLDVILMRKDPPFNMEYIYVTYLLELAEQQGVLIVNKPQSLRDANEKLFTAWFPEHTPATLVSRDMQRLKGFLLEQQDIIVKPLDGMGGASIFRLREHDPNTNVILESITDHGRHFVMAQSFIPAIDKGDKRILMVNGEAIPYVLARIPAQGETRGNLAAGGRGEGQPINQQEQTIADAVGPVLRDKGILFAGLDVIGDRLTEINVTSPTCIRELDQTFGLNIAGTLMDVIAARIEL
jgi:glutathione synthase